MGLGSLRSSHDDDLEDTEVFSEINITPLTDLFLVMLVIFMLATAAVFQKAMDKASKIEESAKELKKEITEKKRAGLEVNLPSGQSTDIDPLKDSLVVTLFKSGEILVNGKKIKSDDLSGVFKSAATKNKNTQVVIKADRGVSHGNVVAVMETAKRWSLTRLAIALQGN